MKQIKLISILAFLCANITSQFAQAQEVPGKEQNIPYLVTFSKQSKTNWGDDDFLQVWYFKVPKELQKPFYIRIYDPEISENFDEIKSPAESKTKFSVYGGAGVMPKQDGTNNDPERSYKSGTMLSTKTFGLNPEYDSKWFSFGPFNPNEGELNEDYNGYIFKLVAEGLNGESGNLYKYFMSSSSQENIPIEGGNGFTYEYTFRVNEESGAVSNIYPFITDDVLAVNIHVFDLDDDCYMRLVSVSKKGEKILGSKDNEWTVSKHTIEDEERKTSLNIQVIKLLKKPNNNIVISITNQYDKLMPFYSVPIGGVPKYKYKIGIKN